MSRAPERGLLLGWMAAAILFAAVCLSVVLSGCAALTAAAPTLLAGVERVLEAELDAAEDEARERELRRAQVLLEECRRAHAAAEDAARRAAEAAVRAQAAAERAAIAESQVEWARAEEAQRKLRTSLVRLRIKVPPAEATAAGTDAGASGAP